MRTAAYWIRRLKLKPHPEGGWYREYYRAAGRIPAAALPARYRGTRAYSTSVFFLLRSEEVSLLHKLHSDELWHWYAGSPLTLHAIDPRGRFRAFRLGPGTTLAHTFQAVLPAGWWFGGTVDRPRSYTLIGCTVAPGFDFRDFELGRHADLLRRFPRHARIIRRLTSGS
jgi:uncharacterized protein